MIKKLLLAFTIVLLAGCCSFAGPSTPQKKYLFNITYPKVSKKYVTADTLEVEQATALQQFSGREFVYRVSNTRYLTDYYHIFMTSITEQVADITARYLAGKGIFKQVSTNNILFDESDYTLRPKVIALYADYRCSSRPLAVIKIRYVLIDNLEKDHPVLIDKVFSQAIPLKTKSTNALMIAWDQGMQNIVRLLSRDLYGMMGE